MLLAAALTLLIIIATVIVVFAVRRKVSSEWNHADDAIIFGLVALTVPLFFFLQPSEEAYAVDETNKVEALGFTIVDGALPDEAGEKSKLTVRSQTMEFDCLAYAPLSEDKETDVICKVEGIGKLAIEEVAKHVDASV